MGKFVVSVLIEYFPPSIMYAPLQKMLYHASMYEMIQLGVLDTEFLKQIDVPYLT